MDPSKYSEAVCEPGEPAVVAFFDGQDTAFTCTFVAVDKAQKKCAVLDGSYNFDPASGVIETRSIDKVINFIKEHGLECQYILETHPHADHLSAAQYVKKKIGGQCCIGAHVTAVQSHFAKFFNLQNFPTDGSQFDCLFHEGDTFEIGSIKCSVVHTPGHTPACITYVIGRTLFCGDVLFMPDMGSARCDFPGGSVETLWNSIQKILAFPPDYKMFPAHDYAPEGRPYKWETTVGEQLQSNKHVKAGTTKEAFIEFRTKRDKELKVPQLLYPSLQVNIRAGHLPPAEGSNQAMFLKIPLTLKE